MIAVFLAGIFAGILIFPICVWLWRVSNGDDI